MATTASDILVDTLVDWGVDTIFGIPGDGINGIIEALRQKQDRIRFIQVHHEEALRLIALTKDRRRILDVLHTRPCGRI